MCGDSNLCHVVHGAGTDLHLKRSPIKGDHRRVQALIKVVFRHCNVVIKLTRDWAPHRVHRPKRRVALAEVFDHNSDRKDVIDLREVRVLSGHLLVDGVQVLRTTGELCMNARTLQLWTEHLNRSRDICSPSIAAHVNKSGELVISLGLERLKGEVLKLPLHLPDAETLRQWRVDLKGLARNAPLLLNAERRERAHIVQAVAKLDQHDADVLRHRQEHLADVLRMLLFRGKCGELTQLRDAVHEGGHLVSESFAELGCGDAGVLWDVVQECCGKRGRIKTEIGKDQRSLRRVCHIRLSRSAHLISVRLHGEIERGSNKCCGACIFMVCRYF